eukprot:g2432.t1
MEKSTLKSPAGWDGDDDGSSSSSSSRELQWRGEGESAVEKGDGGNGGLSWRPAPVTNQGEEGGWRETGPDEDDGPPHTSVYNTKHHGSDDEIIPDVESPLKLATYGPGYEETESKAAALVKEEVRDGDRFRIVKSTAGVPHIVREVSDDNVAPETEESSHGSAANAQAEEAGNLDTTADRKERASSTFTATWNSRALEFDNLVVIGKQSPEKGAKMTLVENACAVQVHKDVFGNTLRKPPPRSTREYQDALTAGYFPGPIPILQQEPRKVLHSVPRYDIYVNVEEEDTKKGWQTAPEMEDGSGGKVEEGKEFMETKDSGGDDFYANGVDLAPSVFRKDNGDTISMSDLEIARPQPMQDMLEDRREEIRKSIQRGATRAQQHQAAVNADLDFLEKMHDKQQQGHISELNAMSADGKTARQPRWDTDEGRISPRESSANGLETKEYENRYQRDQETIMRREGDRVEAKLPGWTRYYKGEITRMHRDGTMDIRFDDGERKRGVREDQLKVDEKKSGSSDEDEGRRGRSSRRRKKTRREGDRVEAKLPGWSRYYKGEITRMHSDGTMDIRFDDGERKRGVLEDQLKVEKDDMSGSSDEDRRFSRERKKKKSRRE